MNILILLAVGTAVLLVAWAIQSVVLKLAGEPLAWPFRYKTRRPLVHNTGRVLIHLSWAAVLIATPLVLGMDLREAFAQAFPRPIPWRDIAIAYAIALVFPALLFALYFAAGWLRIWSEHPPAIRRGKLFRRFLGPWPLAAMEEAVFRGVLLEQLLRSLPPLRGFTALAVVVSAAIFASMHFVKPQGTKPIWQPAYGYFIVGCLFGLAYVVGGRSLWLPITMHAGTVFVVEVMRLYTVVEGPRCLVGYSEWPQSGVIGSVFVVAMGIALVALV
jgi:membrane protease YdiL (CAAX protease family)